ncbi:MAG: MFS transporter [Burkholderiaceae bacterium]
MTNPAEFNLRQIAVPAFAPSMLYGIADGAVLPVVALSALELGTTPAVAGFIAALAGIGALVSNVPAAAMTARIGERRAMLAAAAIAMIGYLLCALSTRVGLMAVGVWLFGMASAVFSLARQTWLINTVPFTMRARALSTLAGSMRIGVFIGPFAGAALIHRFGLHGAYGAAMLALLVLIVIVWRLPELPDVPEQPAAQAGGSAGGPVTGSAGGSATGSVGGSVSGSVSGSAAGTPAAGSTASLVPSPSSFRAVLRSHAHVYRTLGIGVVMVAAMRASRQVVVPLWSDALGLSAASASLIYGLAAMVDMTVFYPAGKVMDRFGRVWIALPCTLLMGCAFLLTPLTTGFTSFLLVAMLLGLANGIGSGIVMTMGADAAPRDNRTRFLGIWRMMADTGSSLGPLLLSSITALASLGAGIAAIGGLGFAAAAVFWRHLPHGRGKAGH